MKIALCIQCPLQQHGGVEVLVRELIKGLHQEFDIYLVSQDEASTISRTLYASMLKGAHFYQPQADPLQQAKLMIEWGKNHGIDLFHFHHGGTYGWGSRTFHHSIIPKVKAAGFRCVSTNHGAFSMMDFIGKHRSILVKLAALCYCWPAKIFQLSKVEWEVAVSQHDFHAVRRWFQPMNHRFIQVYHSVLDGQEPLCDDKKRVVLCLGTVGFRKGQNYLADAFGQIAKNHPDWRLVIAGRHAQDGTPDAMFAAIQKHGIAKQVDILTDVPDSMAWDLLRTSAIFAMPSVAEGLGLSLQEAMFHGAACTGSSAGGITDMILHEKTGLLVPPADPNALAMALDRLMRDPALCKQLSTRGRQWITEKDMTKQGMCHTHARLYRQ